MEEAEHELLRSLGLGVICEADGQRVSFPRVNAECNYRSAIRFEEVIDIEVGIKRIGSKSITYAFNFTRGETKIADGSITTVCCKFDRQHDGKPESVAIPASIVNALQPYLAIESA